MGQVPRSLAYCPASPTSPYAPRDHRGHLLAVADMTEALLGGLSAGAERVADVGERNIWQEAPPFFSADCGPPARRPSASPGPARTPGGSGVRSWDPLPSRL
jgi:hypothetical protein